MNVIISAPANLTVIVLITVMVTIFQYNIKFNAVL